MAEARRLLWSKLFLPTQREEPAEASGPAHRQLIRAGYMRRQDYLFLGRRTLRKIVQIVRDHMDGAGGQEFQFATTQAMLNIAEELRSPKQLPQVWYQFRDFTCQCFIFGAAKNTPACILDRCGIQYVAGDDALFVYNESGPEIIAAARNYAATIESATSIATTPAIPDPAGDLAPVEFHTPDRKTIAEVSEFTGLPETSQIKTLVLIADGKPILALVRGDHQLSETKLRNSLGIADLRPARADEIRERFGADAGSLGPVGVKGIRIVADASLRGRRDMICGANRNDYHLRNVTPGEDFEAEFADLRQASAGETSPDGTPLAMQPGRVLARVRPNGWDLLLDRILITAVDQNRDANGLMLPPAIAPFETVVTPVANDETQLRIAAEIFDALTAAGIDAVLDDRDERPGVKFKDADLIGIPYRINVGRKAAEGIVEVMERRSRELVEVPAADAAGFVRQKLK